MLTLFVTFLQKISKSERQKHRERAAENQVIMNPALVSLAVDEARCNWQDNGAQLQVQPPLLAVSQRHIHTTHRSHNVHLKNWFQTACSGRGHLYKFLKWRLLHHIGKYSFSNRVIDNWNQLPEDIVSCTSVSVNSFKNRLGCFTHKRGFI